MNWKKVSIVIICLLTLGFLLESGLKFWVKNSLPSFINEKNDTPYNFTYSDVSYSLFARRMTIKGIQISPKIKKKEASFVTTNRIVIHGVHFLKFFAAKDLIADLIEIDAPDIIIKQNPDSINRKKELTLYKLGNSIQIKNFVINKGKVQLFNSKNNTKTASLDNLNIHLSGVVWDVINKEKRIPISYDKAKLSIDKVFYQLNEIHHINLNSVKLNNGFIETRGIRIQPDISDKEFNNGNYSTKSFMNVKIPVAKIKNLDWGYDSNGLFYVNTSKIEVDATDISILGKPEVSSPSKNVTTYINRIIPFNLKIDSVQILKSKLNINNHVTSNNINILIKNIHNSINDKITVEQLKLYDNFVTIYQQKPSSSQNQSNFTYLFDDILEIKNFSIQNSNIRYFNTNNIQTLDMGPINYQLNDIVINTVITNTKKTVPFSYTTYMLEANQIFYSALKNYSFKIKKMKLANDVFSAHELEMIPKISPVRFAHQKSGKNLFKININNIDIPKINWGIKNDKFIIQAPDLSINTMIADIYQNKNAKGQSKKLQLDNSELDVDVSVNSLKLTHSSVNIHNAQNGQLLTSAQDLTLNVQNILLNDTSENTSLGLPFSFSKFSLTGKKVFQSMDFHTLTLDNFHFTDHSFTASTLKVRPKENKKNIMKEKGIDAYSIDLSHIDIPNLNMGLPDKEIQLTAPQVTLTQLKATIHQYDIPDDNYIPVSKPLFSKKLRDLKFKLQLGQINLKDSYLSYEEESVDKGTGKIYFTDINARIKNVNSAYKTSPASEVEVDFKSKFMYTGTLTALWKFNVNNDRFTVNGKISRLPAEKVNMFIKPYLQVSAEGMLDEVIFNFHGNNDKGNGTFGMNYKDLKVTLYKKNGKEEKKLLSGLANLAVKGNTKDSLKVSSIKEVERSKDKSFFNFLWKMTLSGLKTNLLRF